MAANDYGIKVISPDNSTFPLMTTAYPFAKLDSTKDFSLKTTRIRFNNDLPEGTTLLASYPHPFATPNNYTPQFWSLIYFEGSAANAISTQTYSNTNVALVQSSVFDQVTIEVRINDTNVLIYAVKSSVATPVIMTGAIVRVTVYCFVDDLLY
jgi:hypothetical protein